MRARGESQEAGQPKTACDTTPSAVTQEGNVSPLSAFVTPRAHTHSATRRSRSALAITETELRLIAALASIGLSSSPKNG